MWRPPIWSRSKVPCPVWDQAPQAVRSERVVGLLENDPELQKAINGRPGVTDGSVAGTGEIGEVFLISGSATIPSFSLSPPYDTILALNPSLPAGDWYLWASATWQRAYPGVWFTLPPPPGFSAPLSGGFWGGTSPTSTMATGSSCHASRTGTVGLVFNINVNPGAGVFTQGTLTLTVEALRLR